MSTAHDTELAALRQLVRRIEGLRRATRRLERQRDREIRRLRNEGVRAVELAQEASLTRGRLYAILEPSELYDVEGDTWHELPGVRERFEEAMAVAEYQWEEHGRRGKPDDYLDLDELLAR